MKKICKLPLQDFQVAGNVSKRLIKGFYIKKLPTNFKKFISVFTTWHLRTIVSMTPYNGMNCNLHFQARCIFGLLESQGSPYIEDPLHKFT